MILCFPQHTTAIILECRTSVLHVDAYLWYNIDQNCSQPCSETKRMKDYGIIFACSIITIKHGDLILDLI